MTPTNYDKMLGKKIKALRVERGYTQEELAKKVGYTSKDSISKLERGAFQIDLSRADKIAKALQVDTIELISSEGNNIPVTVEYQKRNPTEVEKKLIASIEREFSHPPIEENKVKFAGYFEYPQDYVVVNEVQQGLTSLTADQMKQVLNFIKAIKS